MRLQALGGLTALCLARLAFADPDPRPLAGPGVDVVYTCPAAATTTVFVTVGQAIDPVPSVVVQTITATVWPDSEPQWTPASPTLPATLTVTIDSYDPPSGGSQYTGPKPWESAVLTSTVYTVPTPIASGASDPGNVGGNPLGSTIQGGQITPGAPGNSGQGTPTALTITLSQGQSPPGFPWNPTKTVTTDCTSYTAPPGGPDGPDGSGGLGGPGGNTDGVTVVTKTLHHTNANPGQATPAVDVVVASFTVTFPQPAASGVVLTQTAYIPSATELPSGPGGPGGPEGPGGPGDAVTSFTTTLYRTRPGSGSGTPTVDTLVTCFTVTFPSATGTPPVGPPNVSVATVIVPTMVPGPDGSLSYSLQTLVSSFIASPSAPAAASTSLVTIYPIPGSGSGGQEPAPATPAVATVTLTLPQPSVSPAISGTAVSSDSGPATVVTTTVFQTTPDSLSTPLASFVTVVLTPGVPPSAGTATAGVPVAPGSPGSVVTQTVFQGDPVPGGYGGAAPSASGLNPAGGLSSFVPAPVQSADPAGGLPSSVQAPVQSVTITVPATGLPQVPAAGGSSAVSVPGGASVANGILGGYSDPAQTMAAPTGAPTPVGSPSVITLWPTSQNTVAGTVQGSPPGTIPGSVQSTVLDNGISATGSALPVPATKTTSCSSTTSPQTTEVSSTAVLTSTLVNIVADATTTYTFPFESLVTSVGTLTVTGDTIGGAPGAPGGTATTTGDSIGGAPVSGTTLSEATVVTAVSSLVLSTWVQSTLVQSTLITSGPAPTLIERRDIQKRQANSTATSASPISVPTPMCSGTTEVGILTLDFDDLPFGPMYNPYHRFWFSKGFLVGPPPAMPYLPSSGGRVLEYVPPMLSNNTGIFSTDTAQIGMGKLASSPCFQFDFYGINLGCDARIQDQLCEFTFTGYQWNATEGEETESFSQKTWVPSCPEMENCPLTPFSATGFVGLSSILVTLRVDGRPRVWWADDLRVGWSNNDCESAVCRQQPGQAVATSDNDPVWYWTPFGIRVLKPSRIHKHFSN